MESLKDKAETIPVNNNGGVIKTHRTLILRER